jgi:hypothetical protein
MYSPRRGWGIGRIFLAAFFIILLFASLFYTLTFFETLLTGTDGRSLISLDWAGYVVVSNYANPQPTIVGVNGSWTVPTVNHSQTDQFSAARIGIGGQLDDTLIQTGTEHDSVSGAAVYSVWYELLPNDSIPITTMNVSPGDQIRASINLVDSVSNKWSIKIRDVTNGETFQNNFFYYSSQLSAEWIVERPTINNTLSGLADFGSATFTGSYATVDTTVGTIKSFPYSQVAMHNRQNNPLVTVSSLDSKDSGFTIDYLKSSTSAQINPVQVLESNSAEHSTKSAYTRELQNRED